MRKLQTLGALLLAFTLTTGCAKKQKPVDFSTGTIYSDISAQDYGSQFFGGKESFTIDKHGKSWALNDSRDDIFPSYDEFMQNEESGIYELVETEGKRKSTRNVINNNNVADGVDVAYSNYKILKRIYDDIRKPELTIPRVARFKGHITGHFSSDLFRKGYFVTIEPHPDLMVGIGQGFDSLLNPGRLYFKERSNSYLGRSSTVSLSSFISKSKTSETVVASK
tara:strand:- start:2701 stop:3369 length:669 start_codon:yes stop_codon:yes gene_type:complete